MSDANFQAGLELFFGSKCKPKKVEEVDMAGKLEAVGLAQFFHVDLWPAAAAVRELATLMKSRTGFIYTDLRKFLPNCCDTHVAVMVETDEHGNEAVAVKECAKGGKRLCLATWLVAWERFSLAVAMLKVMDFGVALRYKQVYV